MSGLSGMKIKMQNRKNHRRLLIECANCFRTFVCAFCVHLSGHQIDNHRCWAVGRNEQCDNGRRRFFDRRNGRTRCRCRCRVECWWRRWWRLFWSCGDRFGRRCCGGRCRWSLSCRRWRWRLHRRRCCRCRCRRCRNDKLIVIELCA